LSRITLDELDEDLKDNSGLFDENKNLDVPSMNKLIDALDQEILEVSKQRPELEFGEYLFDRHDLIGPERSN
jgi:hypothetical protein